MVVMSMRPEATGRTLVSRLRLGTFMLCQRQPDQHGQQRNLQHADGARTEPAAKWGRSVGASLGG